MTNPFAEPLRAIVQSDTINVVSDLEGWAKVHGLMLGNGTHPPLTLYPHVISRKVYEHAVELAPLFSKLIHKMSYDTEFIVNALAHVSDDFTVKLVDILKTTHKEGTTQPLSMAVHRSDYMIHQGKELQQVELNTISSAMAGLTSVLGEMHDYILHHYAEDIPRDGHLSSDPTMKLIPASFKVAFELYKERHAPSTNKLVILFLVQPGERNSIDQKILSFSIYEQYGYRILRRSLTDIAERGSLGPSGQLLIDGYECAIAYYRSGYTPTDYPSEKEWAARLLVERSLAIKCPNIAYHLLGTKKIQQVISKPGIIEKYLTEEESKVVRACFTGLYSLDAGESQDVIQLALANPHEYVMKPQREGGGYLIFGDEMVKALTTMSPDELSSYILMKRIIPIPQPAVIVHNGSYKMVNTICELGVYCLNVSDEKQDYLCGFGGWLLRSKDETVEDGGIVSGRAVLDSILLVDM